MGSTNGTFVNEKDVDREQLNDGDVITFGMTKATFVGDKPKARVNPNRAAPDTTGRPMSRNPARAQPGVSGSRAAAAPAAAEVPEAGIVTDAPRRSAPPAPRAAVETQDEGERAALR